MPLPALYQSTEQSPSIFDCDNFGTDAMPPSSSISWKSSIRYDTIRYDRKD